VRSFKAGKKVHKKAKIMRLRKDRDGYVRVTLQNDKGQKVVKRIHVLVARAFLGPARGRLVCHKKNRRNDPRLSNIRYGSYEDNKNDKYTDGTHQIGENNSRAQITKKEAKQILKFKDKIPQSELAKMYGISRQAVSDIQRKKSWQA
jgi:hypothetical protein